MIAAAALALTLQAPEGLPPATVAPPAAARAADLRVPVLHTAGLMLGMRVALSALWPEAYDPLDLTRAGRNLRAAYTQPPELRRERSPVAWDGDPWPINIVGHGLFGAEVYGRTRRCGTGPLGALAFTTAASTFWEYGPEALHKRPSSTDLIFTPVLGLLIGEGRHQLIAWIETSGRGRRSRLRRAAAVVLDPLGSLERALGAPC